MKIKCSNYSICWIFAILLFSCGTKSLSKQATKTFNHKICNDYTYLSGSLNVNLKYILSNVFKLPEFRYNKDTTYCILRNYEFSGTTVAFCFNRTDSIFVHLYNDPDSGNLKIKYKLNDKFYRYNNTITSSKISSNKIEELKEYKCYFDSLVFSKVDKSDRFGPDDGRFNSMILRICRTNDSPIQFYKFIGDSLIREPFKKLETGEQKFKIKVY